MEIDNFGPIAYEDIGQYAANLPLGRLGITSPMYNIPQMKNNPKGDEFVSQTPKEKSKHKAVRTIGTIALLALAFLGGKKILAKHPHLLNNALQAVKTGFNWVKTGITKGFNAIKNLFKKTP